MHVMHVFQTLFFFGSAFLFMAKTFEISFRNSFSFCHFGEIEYIGSFVCGKQSTRSTKMGVPAMKLNYGGEALFLEFSEVLSTHLLP